MVLSFYPRKKTASMEEEDDGRSIVKEASLPRLVQRDSHRVLKKNKNNKKLIQAILLWVLLIVLGGPFVKLAAYAAIIWGIISMVKKQG